MSTGLWKNEREQDYSRDLYNSRLPREYHPNLNAPAVQSDYYVPDTDWESHHIPHSDNPLLFGAFPDSDPVEQPITYGQSRMMSKFFLRDMEDQYQSAEDTEEISSVADIQSMHNLPDLKDVTEALVQLREVFAEDDPDIVSLTTAVRMLGAIQESAGHADGIMPDEINQAIDRVTEERMAQEMELDPFQMQYDPYAIAQRIFDQQIQYMDNPLLMPEQTGPIQDPMLGF